MQQRLNETMGVFRGCYNIFKAAVDLQSTTIQSTWQTSTVREGLKDSVSVISKASVVNPIESGAYLANRMQMFAQQNAILLRSALSSSSSQPNYSADSTSSESKAEPGLKLQTLPVSVNKPQPNPIELSNYNPDSYDALSDSKERRVPSSRVGRIAGFGNLAVGLGLGAAAEYTRRFVGYDSGKSSSVVVKNLFLTDANLERIVDTLCRMRGAALKLGQMLSIQDESTVSPQLQKIFERVRQAADFMPARQMNKVLSSELGPDWRTLLAEFDEKPFAAASIGQVHRGVLHDGRVVAMKIQYPGIVDSIDADINNLMSLLNRFDVLPRGMFADRAIEVAKRELREECDYLREASFSNQFAQLLAHDPVFHVPPIIEELTSPGVLTHELANGIFLDKCSELPQDIRDWLGEQLLRLCLEELFVYRVMQTDPNWSNFMYDPDTGKIILLDFGASRSYGKEFIDVYIRLIHAASVGDREGIVNYSQTLGFLTGYESKVMIDAHIDAVSILGEAFAADAAFDFGLQSTTKRINRLIPVMLEHRLVPPPDESYSLHRKMSGCFLLCGKLKAKVNCHPLFRNIWANYRFDQADDQTTTSTEEAVAVDPNTLPSYQT